MRPSLRHVAGLLGLVLILCGGSVGADDKVEVSKFRQGAMKVMAANLKDILRQRGESENAGPLLVSKAEVVATLAEGVRDLFPPDSEYGRAKGEIWTDREGFDRAALAAAATAKLMVAAAYAGDAAAMGRHAKALADRCVACHKTFRHPKSWLQERYRRDPTRQDGDS